MGTLNSFAFALMHTARSWFNFVGNVPRVQLFVYFESNGAEELMLTC